jgi:hypothetical protein
LDQEEKRAYKIIIVKTKREKKRIILENTERREATTETLLIA